MSASINLNLNGVGDEIAVAVAEAMRKQLATFQCQTASIIGKQVSEQVAAALKTALLDLQKPTFDVREQIFANAHAILSSHRGSTGFEAGITVVVINSGEHIQAFVVSTSGVRSHGRDSVHILLTGPPAASSTDALEGLFSGSRRALVRAWKLRDSENGFCDFTAIYAPS